MFLTEREPNRNKQNIAFEMTGRQLKIISVKGIMTENRKFIEKINQF